MSAPLPRELTLLCSAAAVMLGACVPDAPGEMIVARDGGPAVERDAGASPNGSDAGVDDAGVDVADAGHPDSGTARDGGVSSGVCPPTGPYGPNVGDVLPDLTFYDCDGNPVSMHTHCGRKASHYFIMAGW